MRLQEPQNLHAVEISSPHGISSLHLMWLRPS